MYQQLDKDIARRKDGISRELQCNQSRGLKLAIAKRCRLHKLIRQRFALALKIQQMVCAYSAFSRQLQCRWEIQSQYLKFRQKRKDKDPADDVYQQDEVLRTGGNTVQIAKDQAAEMVYAEFLPSPAGKERHLDDPPERPDDGAAVC
ncbi:hypothetical protein F511_05777 [Dorcoceras hygrometricum]|uniref:Uncharacterized protein n=1 Tax=Dorcoceras hygrometricum TaxID=472368 RepID=A0A2Z7BJ12_9LAMI|nr:hypothetical protein F511_05777 [Dorcoceras hygrometricum]